MPLKTFVSSSSQKIALSKNHKWFLSEKTYHNFLFLWCTELDFVGEEIGSVLILFICFLFLF